MRKVTWHKSLLKCISLGVACVAMVGSFAACGGAASTSASTAASGSAAGEEPITLHILHFMGEETKRNGLQKWCDTFTEQHPNVTFEIEAVAYAQFDQTVKTRIAAGDMPDIITGRPRDWREFIEGGHIMDLSGQPFLDNLTDEFREEMTLDGGVYGLPVDTAIKGVFYNKDMFAERGLEVPTTYTEWVNVMDTFEAEGMAPFARPFKDTNAPETDFKASFNVTLNYEDPQMWEKVASGEAKVADFPFFKEELEKFAKRMSYTALDDYGNDPARALQLFAAGEAPMMINGNWIMGDLFANAPDGNFGVFPLPWSEDPAKNQFETKTDDVFMVAQSTQHKDEVLEFLNFVGSDEGAQIWMEEAGLMPANKNVTLDDSVNDLLKAIDAQLKDGKACYVYEILELTGEPKDIYRKSLHSLVGDTAMKADIDAFISQLDQDITTALNK